MQKNRIRKESLFICVFLEFFLLFTLTAGNITVSEAETKDDHPYLDLKSN